MTSNDREQLARRSIEDFGGPDWEATVRELCAPGVVHEETGTGRRTTGVDAAVEGLRAWKTAFPNVSGEVLRVLSAGDDTAIDIIWRGTHTGPLDTGAGAMPPTGVSLQVRATNWQHWEDGRIVHEHHHLDMLSMLAQLGALPAPASA